MGSGSTRKILWYGVGAFWLLDALLQMQPHMFSSDLVTSIMMPNAFNQPKWVTDSIDWMLNLLITHNLALFNWFIAVIQLVIGALILTGYRRRWGTLGLWLSLIWGVGVWYFGEGLGTILTGQSTYLTGGPGSVVLYMAIAIILLLPKNIWHDRTGQRPLEILRNTLVGLWCIGAVLQALPGFWTHHGLWTQIYGSAVMTPQSWVTAPIYAVAHLTLYHTALWNLLFIVIMLLEAAGLWFRWGPWFYWASGLWLIFMFWIGENLGMILSGITTDLNTAPLWALMMWPLYRESVRLHRPLTSHIHLLD